MKRAEDRVFALSRELAAAREEIARLQAENNRLKQHWKESLKAAPSSYDPVASARAVESAAVNAAQLETNAPVGERVDPAPVLGLPHMADSSSDKHSVASISLLMCSTIIVAATAVVYGGLLGGLADREWLQYDDPVNFDQNDLLKRGWSCANLAAIWTLPTGVVLGVWEPIALIFKLVYRELLGSTPRVAAMLSVGLHTTNALLGFIFVEGRLMPRLGQPENVANGRARHRWQMCCLVGALFFAVHPLRVETVQWASAQSYLLAGLLLLFAAFCHGAAILSSPGRTFPAVASCTSHVRCARAGATVFYSLATLSKAAAVPTILLFVAAEIVVELRAMQQTDAPSSPGITNSRRNFYCLSQPVAAYVRVLMRATWANWAMVLAAAIAAVAAKTAAGDGGRGHDAIGTWQKLLRAAYALIFYARQTLWPHGLFLRYPARPAALVAVQRNTGHLTIFGQSLVLVIALSTAPALILMWLWITRRLASRSTSCCASKLAVAWIAWIVYVGLLSPTLGLAAGHGVPLLAADRYTYIPALLMGMPATAHLLYCMLMYLSPLKSIDGTTEKSKKRTNDGSSRLPMRNRFVSGSRSSLLGQLVFGLGLVWHIGSLGFKAADYSQHWEAGTDALWQYGLSLGDPWILGVVGEPSWPHIQRGYQLLYGKNEVPAAKHGASMQTTQEALASFQRALEVEPSGPAAAAAEVGSGHALLLLPDYDGADEGAYQAAATAAAFERAIGLANGAWPAARAWFQLGHLLERENDIATPKSDGSSAKTRKRLELRLEGVLADVQTAAECYQAAALVVERHCTALRCPATADGETRTTLATLRAQALANLATFQLANGAASASLEAADAVLNMAGAGGPLVPAPAELATSWYNRALSLERLQRLAEAVTCYAIAAEIDTGVNTRESDSSSTAVRKPTGTVLWSGERALAAKALSNRGNALGKIGRYPEAAASCEAALSINPSYAEAWVNLGAVRVHSAGAEVSRRRLEEAAAAFKNAVQLRPTLAVAANNLAAVQARLRTAQ